jgi:hypothetical protein
VVDLLDDLALLGPPLVVAVAVDAERHAARVVLRVPQDRLGEGMLRVELPAAVGAVGPLLEGPERVSVLVAVGTGLGRLVARGMIDADPQPLQDAVSAAARLLRVDVVERGRVLRPLPEELHSVEDALRAVDLVGGELAGLDVFQEARRVGHGGHDAGGSRPAANRRGARAGQAARMEA